LTRVFFFAHMKSPNMSRDSSVNWPSQHSQHMPS
jgi:hypothetical protein